MKVVLSSTAYRTFGALRRNEAHWQTRCSKARKAMKIFEIMSSVQCEKWDCELLKRFVKVKQTYDVESE